VRADLLADPPKPNSFDLVSLQYYPLPVAAGPDGVRGLADAVAPGGTLLVTGHDTSAQKQRDPRFNPEDFYTTQQIAQLLRDGWEILVEEARPRARPMHDGSKAPDDLVLKARRKA
jgi:hypothetical protein